MRAFLNDLRDALLSRSGVILFVVLSISLLVAMRVGNCADCYSDRCWSSYDCGMRCYCAPGGEDDDQGWCVSR